MLRGGGGTSVAAGVGMCVLRRAAVGRGAGRAALLLGSLPEGRAAGGAAGRGGDAMSGGRRCAIGRHGARTGTVRRRRAEDGRRVSGAQRGVRRAGRAGGLSGERKLRGGWRGVEPLRAVVRRTAALGARGG